MPRYLHNHEDDCRNVSTYELADGRRVTLDNHEIREHGVNFLLHHMGLADDPAAMPRRPVYWCGQMIGTLPSSFNPANVRSRSWLYCPRPGDFVAEGNGWVASEALGPGDIKVVEGFRPA